MNKASHLTWEKPTINEIKELNSAMIKKLIRILLSSATIFGYVVLVVWLRNLELPLNAEVVILIIFSLPILIYYLGFRGPLIFGERQALDEYIRERTMVSFLIGVCNIVVIPVFYIFFYKIGFIAYILIAIMALCTYWREYFMLLLFAFKKYEVKDGIVYYRKKYRNLEITENLYRGFIWSSLIYLLEFEDAGKRQIPVMVDRYTYRKFRENSNAILINYKYGDSYMFELIKLSH